MLERDLNTSYESEEQRRLYQELMDEGLSLFRSKSDKITIFHHVLVDRVADAYVYCLRVDTETFNEKRYKAAQDKLQRWLTLTFQELNSAEKASQARREFFKACVEELTKLISDVGLRREVFACLKRIVEEGG